MILRLTAAAALLTLAACSVVPSAPQPSPPPAPRPAPAPPPPPASSNWMDARQTPGDWRYIAGSGQTSAVFGTRGETIFSLTCDRTARSVTLARAGAATSSIGMRIRTETAERVIDAAPRGNGTVAATLPARDPLLDAMAFSKGRVAVEATGLAPLYLPSWIEVSRILEDCR